jgi:hypothetical protein
MSDDWDYEDLESALETAPLTWVPALLITLVTRCAQEPIFNGWLGFHSTVQKAWSKAHKEKKP